MKSRLFSVFWKQESPQRRQITDVTGAKYIPVVVNPHFRHCFKPESGNLNLDVPWTRWISLLPHYLLSINKRSPSSSFWVKFHSKVEAGSPGPLSAGQAASAELSSNCELHCMPGDPWDCLVTRQVTGHGALLCCLSGPSRPVPSGVPWEATIYSASIHKAQFGDQRYKQKGRVWWVYISGFYNVTQELLSLELFVCYSYKLLA